MDSRDGCARVAVAGLVIAVCWGGWFPESTYYLRNCHSENGFVLDKQTSAVDLKKENLITT